MIKQTVLPFKIEITKDTITPHAGLALVGELAAGIGMLEAADRELPGPGSGGLDGLERVEQKLLKRGMKNDEIKGYTLDIDATGIVAEKESAKMTYKGYMPIAGRLAENGFVVGDEFREGNESPGGRNLEFLKRCIKQMPKGKRIRAMREDSAAYQAEVINYCEENGIEFAIGADLDEAALAAIRSIPKVGWMPYENG